MPIVRVDPSCAAVLLIDAQPAFWSCMHGSAEPVMSRIEHLLALTSALGLPCIATFEHPVEQKGWLPERLERVFPGKGQRFVKHSYDCCAESAIREAIHRIAARQMIVAGAETDVCVLQSVLGLLTMGLEVFLLEDCLFTSEPRPEPALARMRQAGAVATTYKSLYYELKRTVDVPQFHHAWNAVDEAQPTHFVAPEALPAW